VRLVEFIRAHPAEIEREWEEFAKTLMPAAAGLSASTLRDHLRDILLAIADDMEAPQNPAQQTEKGKGEKPMGGALDRIAAAHTGMRLDSGFDLEHALAEYRALRASILRLWSLSAPSREENSVEDVTRFNETIDEAIAEVVSRYSNRTTRYSDRFVAILAHDIRTPLSLISLSAGLLGAGPLQEQQAHSVSRILQSVRRIDRLVDDLAVLVRSRVGSPLPLAKRNIDLGVICEQALEEVKASHKQASFELQKTGDLKGNWDGERLAQVVSNLVVNAIVHASAEKVRVLVQGDGPEVVLKVANQGAPIPPGMLDSIFEPLVHQSGETGTLSGGLGLGLFIVREIVAAHKGTVEVASAASEGTTFAVRLPRIAD
jgi:hypothetical protein